MATAGELRLDFLPTEKPDWRHTGRSTSSMVEEITKWSSKYEQMEHGQKKLCATKAYLQKRALAEYLHQVNNIEGEGFDSYEETLEAITSGALSLDEGQDDRRLESMCCLYRALSHWFKQEDEVPPCLCVQELESCHKLLLGSTEPEIAGRVRSQEEEIVYVETDDGGVHVFMWPTEVKPALAKLLDKTDYALRQALALNGEDRVLQLLKLGGAFFFEFESIHPFLDGNGRSGRVMLAYILQSIMPFPNVLFVDGASDYGLPPFVPPVYYYDCFQKAESEQKFEFHNGRPVFTKNAAQCILDYPRDLTALIIEGVYVGWKRFFDHWKKEVDPTPRGGRGRGFLSIGRKRLIPHQEGGEKSTPQTRETKRRKKLIKKPKG